MPAAAAPDAAPPDALAPDALARDVPSPHAPVPGESASVTAPPAHLFQDDVPPPEPVIAAPPTGGRKWTDEQWRGITTAGRGLLVSAAAGSGKTAVLSERCVHLVCDAADPCDVDELLVVTFTEAAAAEMKSRITEALRARAANGPSDRLARQLALTGGAQISTLHAFCARVLRQHFHLVGLDPNFGILDGEEAKLLRTETARSLFEDRYELDAAGRFQRFVDAYADGDDERLLRHVVRTRETLCSLVEPGQWLTDARRRIEEAADGPLLESALGKELEQIIRKGIESLSARCGEATSQVGRMEGFEKYCENLKQLAVILGDWGGAFRDGLDMLASAVQGDLPKLPSVRNTVPDKALAKAAVDSVRGPMKEGRWRELLAFKTSEWQAGLAGVAPHARVFLDLVDQFERRYTLAKESSRVLDFSDLERHTLNVLREPDAPGLRPSWVARSYHRRFRHVLVDEYQDINEVQDAILTLTSRECVYGEPGVENNLFCVGDVKQSIYRFRLAEPARFLARQATFRAAAGDDPLVVKGEVIDLQANFRSRAPLLEAINRVFERLMTKEAVDIEYDETHRLRPRASYPGAPGNCFTGSPIELHLLPDKFDAEGPAGGAVTGGAATGDAAEPAEGESCDDGELDRSEREAVLVARRIREIMGLEGGERARVMEKAPDGSLRPRPVRFSDVVILLRSMRVKADVFADVLRQSGVPVHSESGTGYFESTEVRDLLNLLRVLDNQRQDVPLASLLRSPLAGLPRPEDALARVRLAYPSRGVPFHEAVVCYAQDGEDELAARLRDFLKQLAEWREAAQRRPLAETFRTVYDATGYLAFCAGLHDGEQRQANLNYLLERARQFDTFHRQGLSRFLQFLENLREESDLGQPSVAGEADDVVRIMSVHRSKGLEFPVVILPDLGKSINTDDCRGPILVDRAAGLGLVAVDESKRVRYPSLASVLVQHSLRRQALAEEMRVLYVAMTRAREHLILVGTCGADAFEQWRDRWNGHAGPLPPEVVLDASRMLDWVGPVAAATAGVSPLTFEVFRHEPAEVKAWQLPAAGKVTLTPEQQHLAALKPLDPEPAASAAADELIARLSTRYAYRAYADLPAVESASSPKPYAREDAQGFATPAAAGVSLAAPRFLLADELLAAADVGEATHLVLQHLDFSRPCDAADLEAQIAEMVERRLVALAQAKAVDLPAVQWLLGTPAGNLLRGNASNLMREVPVYVAADGEVPHGAPRGDPLDRVMVRGRIDVLVPSEAGPTILDYKTDAVRPDEVPGRAELYRPQMQRYREAVEAITGQRVGAAVLVFLRARVVYSL